jgi:hypothetical protein
LVSHAWNPACDTAEALAGRRLVRGLLHAGATVDVLSASRAEEDLPSPKYRVTTVAGRPFASHKLARAFQMIRAGIPEAECTWVSSAVEAGRELLAELPNHTTIYGRAMPGASNIVAWHLAREVGRPWIAHFSDEWPPLHVLSRGMRYLAPYKEPLFRLWRRRIIRDAGALTFTNPRQAEYMLGSHAPEATAKTFVATHLPSRFETRIQPPQYEQFHIVHTGNLYPSRHSGAALMQGVQLFLERTPEARQCTRFIQAGWASGDLPVWAHRCGLGDIVRFEARLNEASVLRLLEMASLLVVIDYSRPDSTTIHSKLADYVNARRPILAITAPTSSLGRMFREDGTGLTAHYNSPPEVADRIAAAFTAWQQHRLEALSPSSVAVEAFSWRGVSKELAGAFTVAARRHVQGWSSAPTDALETAGFQA